MLRSATHVPTYDDITVLQLSSVFDDMLGDSFSEDDPNSLSSSTVGFFRSNWSGGLSSPFAYKQICNCRNSQLNHKHPHNIQSHPTLDLYNVSPHLKTRNLRESRPPWPRLIICWVIGRFRDRSLIATFCPLRRKPVSGLATCQENRLPIILY